MFALFFLLGVSLALQLPSLPDSTWLFLFFPLLFCLIIFPRGRIYLALPVGFIWAISHGLWLLSTSLPDELIKKDILVTGKVVSLPDKNEFRTRFVFDVETLQYNDARIQGPKRVRLNWYGKSVDIHAGETWQLKVRLKPPHGMQNPGGFDYEKWLFERGIRATGYVRKDIDNQLIEKPNPFSVNVIRESLKKKVVALLPDSEFRGLILALVIGDRSEIKDDQWQVLTATGTNHLVAISGLHIGLVAGAIYFLVSFLMKYMAFSLQRMPAHKTAAICALIAAFLYAMLAGFAIPTQRALVMTSVIMLGILLNKRFSYFQILSFALLAVLIIDPFSVMSAGFWLSFIAVAAILYAMQGRLNPKGWWWHWGRMQWIISLAIAPVLIFVFQNFSLISPVANLLAVPWVSFVTVPLVLLGSLFAFIDPIAQVLFSLANLSLEVFWGLLVYLSDLRFSQWQHFVPQTWTLFPAALAIMLLLAPRGFPARYLALLFLLPLFLVKPDKLEQDQFKFHLLDVGKGLAAVIQTRNHILLFDTGPKFRSGFNTGEAVILPFLKSLAVNEVDKVIISHGDNDHIGGLSSILENVLVKEILSGQPEKINSETVTSCEVGQHWHWDGVDFTFLHPNETTPGKPANNRSCVLRISVADKVLLLTGDIEKRVERELVNNASQQIQADVLVAAHHGSNTSSTSAFIESVDPDWVLFPAGYYNRFKFPTSKVLARFKSQSVPYRVTGSEGAISVLFAQGIELTPVSYRSHYQRFWHRD